MRDINTAALLVFIAVAILAGVGKPLSDRVRHRRMRRGCYHARLRRPRVRYYRLPPEFPPWETARRPRIAAGRNRYLPDDPGPPITVSVWLAVGTRCLSLEWIRLVKGPRHGSG